MNRLEGRVALVSGAANGIGRATAERLAVEGAAVMISDVADDGGKAAATELSDRGLTVSYTLLDVVSEDAWNSAVKAAVAEFGGLDILVNNAGVHGEGPPIQDTTLEAWERQVAILQTGVFLGMKAAFPALEQSEHASVINISSIYGTSGGFGTSPAYHAAKGAVRTLTKNGAISWARHKIRVNSIHPGFIDTALIRPGGATTSSISKMMTDVTPLGRLGLPQEVAAGVAYLASDDASFVTGSELYIDGGFAAT